MTAHPLAEAGPGKGTAAAAARPARAGTAGPAAVGPEDFAALAGDWLALAGRAAEDNVFHSPEIAGAAGRHLADGLRLVTVRTGQGGLAALAPVRPARLGRLAPAIAVLSHDYGPLGVPLAEAGAAEALADALLDAAAAANPRAALILPMVPAGGPLATALTRRAAPRERVVVLRSEGARAMLDRAAHGGDPRHALPRRRRKEFARQLRRLADHGPVTFEAAAAPAELRLALAEFLALEVSGWKGRRGTALAYQAEAKAFAREVVDALAGRGACRILSLRVAGRPAAMLVCFLGARTASTWKIAFDEAFAAFSPGAQLMLEAPRVLFAEPGIERIDSLAVPGHPMIDPLWPGRLPLATVVVAPARGRLLFRAGLAARAAEDAARALVRRLRRGPAAGRPPLHGESRDEPSAT